MQVETLHALFVEEMLVIRTVVSLCGRSVETPDFFVDQGRPGIRALNGACRWLSMT